MAIALAAVIIILNTMIVSWFIESHSFFPPVDTVSNNGTIYFSGVNVTRVEANGGDTHNGTGQIIVPRLGNAGTIHVTGVEAYGGDAQNSSGKISVQWGTLYPGDSKSVTCFMKSISNTDVKLKLDVKGWNPQSLSSYLTLSWNYSGTPLSPKQEIPVKLTLTIPFSADFINYLVDNAVTNFSFDIYITATEA